MSGVRKALLILISFFLAGSLISSHANEDIENLIDIAESNSEVIAIIKGIRTIPVRLRANEKVLWTDSRGHLAAFLTDARFFVISTSSGFWQVLRLKLDEPENAMVALSPFMALLVTQDRAIGFNAATKKFVELRLPVHDELVTAQVEKYVAVVITSSRAFGLASRASSFTEIRLKVKETLEEVKITATKVTIRTSERLLSFVASGSGWREHRLN